MALDESKINCWGCGAVREPGVLVCRYCDHPFVENLDEVAIPCWNCKTWNEWESTNCQKCASNLLVACMNCQSDVPHHLGRCIRCGVTF